jgi:putative transposase
VALSKLVNSLKGVSSRYLRQGHGQHLGRYLWDGHLWSPSYFAGSCGGAPLAVVGEYIENQKRPRRVTAFLPAVNGRGSRLVSR